MGGKKGEKQPRNFAVNRQASHLYHLLEKFEAGLELAGTEVKSIREGKVHLKDSYGMVKQGEAWLMQCHVGAYRPGSYLNHASLRERKLLLHRAEIEKLESRTRERGLTIIPLRLYLKGNRIKCELALAKGKKIYDHREDSRRRTIDREAAQAMHDHQRRHR